MRCRCCAGSGRADGLAGDGGSGATQRYSGRLCHCHFFFIGESASDLTAEEALAAVEAEGLTLVRADRQHFGLSTSAPCATTSEATRMGRSSCTKLSTTTSGLFPYARRGGAVRRAKAARKRASRADRAGGCGGCGTASSSDDRRRGCRGGGDTEGLTSGARQQRIGLLIRVLAHAKQQVQG